MNLRMLVAWSRERYSTHSYAGNHFNISWWNLPNTRSGNSSVSLEPHALPSEPFSSFSCYLVYILVSQLWLVAFKYLGGNASPWSSEGSSRKETLHSSSGDVAWTHDADSTTWSYGPSSQTAYIGLPVIALEAAEGMIFRLLPFLSKSWMMNVSYQFCYWTPWW